MTKTSLKPIPLLVASLIGVIVLTPFFEENAYADLSSLQPSVQASGDFNLSSLEDSLLSVSLQPPSFPSLPSSSKRYAPNQLLIKFRSSGPYAFTQDAESLFKNQVSWASAVAYNNSELDKLNKEAGLVAVKGLLGRQGGMSTAQALRKETEETTKILSRYPQRTTRAAKDAIRPSLTGWYRFTFTSGTDIVNLIRRYKKLSEVEAVQPNYIIEKRDLLPNDTYIDPDQNGAWAQGAWAQNYADLWGLKLVGAPKAWETTQGRKPDGKPIIVAVVDSGIDYNHPDLWKNIYVDPTVIADRNSDGVVDLDDADLNGNHQIEPNEIRDHMFGWDIPYNDNDPKDLIEGHGTHVAGTIAATANNGIGIAGVAPQAKILPVKGFDDNGGGFTEWLAEAVHYAATHGADVINNSWGCVNRCPQDPILEDVVREAYGLGSVIVFAAGNSHDDVQYYSPENMAETIAVAASDHEDKPSDFSNYGTQVDVAAPGGDSGPSCENFGINNILSLRAGNTDPYATCGDGWKEKMVVGEKYYRARGTSMAAPHTSGVAALILAKHPDISNEDVRQILMASSDDIDKPGFDNNTGAGRINAFKALQIDSVPQLKITTPANNANFGKRDTETVSISGTAAGTNFLKYELFYRAANGETAWQPIGPAVLSPVIEGPLGEWRIKDIPENNYHLMLKVTTQNGFSFQEVVGVNVLWAAPILILNQTTAVSVAISGDRIVWLDSRSSEGFETWYEIFWMDLNTGIEKKIPNVKLRPFEIGSPEIWGDTIIWKGTDGIRPTLNKYDIKTNTRSKLLDFVNGYLPQICGDRIVWGDPGPGSDSDNAFLYSLKSNSMKKLLDWRDNSEQKNPDISGDRVVWLDDRHRIETVYLYDLTTEEQRRIPPIEGRYPDGKIPRPDDFTRPKIWKDKIFWIDTRGELFDKDLYYYDLATETEHAITQGKRCYSFKVSENRVVWTDDRYGPVLDIFLYDLDKKTEQRITKQSLWNLGTGPAFDLSGNRLIFEDDDKKLYLVELGPQNHPPVLEFSDLIEDNTIQEEQSVRFTFTVTDPDHDPMAWQIHPAPLPRGVVMKTIDSRAGQETKEFTWTPDFNQAGGYEFSIRAMDPSDASAAKDFKITVEDIDFIRGDANSDGEIDMSDVIRMLLYMFKGAEITLNKDAADFNDDGYLDISDAINLLQFLYKGGPNPPPPFPNPGIDPTSDNLN